MRARKTNTPGTAKNRGHDRGRGLVNAPTRDASQRVKVKYTAPHLVAVEYRGQRGALLSSGFEFESGSYFVVEFVLRSSHLWLFAPFLCGVRTCSYGARPLFARGPTEFTHTTALFGRTLGSGTALPNSIQFLYFILFPFWNFLIKC